MKPSQIIRGGIAEIETNGWCQHSLRDDEGRLCLLGALIRASGGTLGENTYHLFDDLFQVMEAREMLEKHILAMGHQWMQIPVFNDARSTTQEDVLLLMKGAAEELEAGGL